VRRIFHYTGMICVRFSSYPESHAPTVRRYCIRSGVARNFNCGPRLSTLPSLPNLFLPSLFLPLLPPPSLPLSSLLSLPLPLEVGPLKYSQLISNWVHFSF